MLPRVNPLSPRSVFNSLNLLMSREVFEDPACAFRLCHCRTFQPGCQPYCFMRLRRADVSHRTTLSRHTHDWWTRQPHLELCNRTMPENSGGESQRDLVRLHAPSSVRSNSGLTSGTIANTSNSHPTQNTSSPPRTTTPSDCGTTKPPVASKLTRVTKTPNTASSLVSA